MIEANTKIIVKRLPMKESEPIELEYRIDRIGIKKSQQLYL